MKLTIVRLKTKPTLPKEHAGHCHRPLMDVPNRRIPAPEPEALSLVQKLTASIALVNQLHKSASRARWYRTTSLQLSTGDTTATISNLLAGDYTITLTDDRGCELIENYTIPEITPIT
ncbi:MAG: hypothetical protein H6572_06130 [Lewinellaceae bacterium]|nr:hypothetical protein [Lewinellaceae bacterium]